MCHHACVKVRRQLSGARSLFLPYGPREHTQVIRHGDEYFLLLSHLTTLCPDFYMNSGVQAWDLTLTRQDGKMALAL